MIRICAYICVYARIYIEDKVHTYIRVYMCICAYTGVYITRIDEPHGPGRARSIRIYAYICVM